VRIIWTAHAAERQREWERRKGITRAVVEGVVTNAEQVAPGALNILIAQSRWQGGLLRVPFIESGEGRKIITLYWTSRIKRYWREQA